MVEKRRSFLKTAVLGSSVALTGVSALASGAKTVSNGVSLWVRLKKVKLPTKKHKHGKTFTSLPCKKE